MASPETLVPNGDDSGWPTGTFEDINETIASADGNVMSATTDPDVLVLDLTASEVVDGDTVTNITINTRARVLGAGGKDDLIFDLLIGGVAQGTAVTHTSVGTSYSTLVSNDIGWNVDRTAAEMAGAQVRITTAQRGKGVAATYEVDAVDVVVTFTAGSSDNPESPGLKALQLNELTPTRLVNHIQSMDIESLALTELTPTTMTDHIQSPDMDNITLTELTPLAGIDWVTSPDLKALALTGYVHWHGAGLRLIGLEPTKVVSDIDTGINILRLRREGYA